MPLTPAQTRFALRPDFVREDLRRRSPEEVKQIGRSFAAASRLADLEADPRFQEQQLAEALDLATGVTREEPARGRVIQSRLSPPLALLIQ